MTRSEFYKWLDEDLCRVENCEDLLLEIIKGDLYTYAPLIVSKTGLSGRILNAIQHDYTLVEEYVRSIDIEQELFNGWVIDFPDLYELLCIEDYELEEIEEMLERLP